MASSSLLSTVGRAVAEQSPALQRARYNAHDAHALLRGVVDDAARPRRTGLRDLLTPQGAGAERIAAVRTAAELVQQIAADVASVYPIRTSRQNLHATSRALDALADGLPRGSRFLDPASHEPRLALRSALATAEQHLGRVSDWASALPEPAERLASSGRSAGRRLRALPVAPQPQLEPGRRSSLPPRPGAFAERHPVAARHGLLPRSQAELARLPVVPRPTSRRIPLRPYGAVHHRVPAVPPSPPSRHDQLLQSRHAEAEGRAQLLQQRLVDLRE